MKFLRVSQGMRSSWERKSQGLFFGDFSRIAS